MKSFKLEFDERVEERLSDVEMKSIAGGIQDDVTIEFGGSMVFCLFSLETWDCKQSRSCKAKLLCVPQM